MEPPESGDSCDTTRRLARTGNRLLLPESLVRTRLVVEANELGDEAAEVALAHEENVVEQLRSESPDTRADARRSHDQSIHLRLAQSASCVGWCDRRGAGDQEDVRGAAKEPRERDLPRRAAEALSDVDR